MKKMTLIILLLVMTSHQSMAKNSWGLSAGVNMSRFSDVSSELKPGFHLGLVRERMLNDNSALEYGLIATSKRTLLKEKTRGWAGWGNDVFLWDIDVNIIYLQLPILYKKYLPVYNDQIFFSVGPVFSLGVSDQSQNNQVRFLYRDSGAFNSKFDYTVLYENELFYPVLNSSVGFEASVGVKLKHIALKLFGNYDFTRVTEIAETSIKKKFMTFGILMTRYF